jgi:phospholipid/cholesterol/gamma-HCH transport system ATP-binding protein
MESQTSNATEPLIELKGICHSFGKTVILDQVDLTIYRGEGLVIIGPSGTGKSTILRIIAGLLAPDAGEIYIKGRLRRGLVEDEQHSMRIALVFQQSALFDSLTVEENIGFYLYEHTQLPSWRIRELVKEKLELVGLPGIGDRYPAELSGGMRKRVSLARAIMENPDNPDDHPKIILYDEPTAGLDPIASTVVEDFVRHFQRCVCDTYVMVTHQESTAERTADRIVMLYHGKIQWQGSTDEAKRTDNPYFLQFAKGSLEGPIRAIE